MIATDLFRCPVTGEELKPEGTSSLVTPSGNHRYPIIDGIPVLLDRSSSLFANVVDSEDPSSGNEPPSTGSRLRGLIPSPTLAVGQKDRYREFRDLILRSDPCTARPIVLVIGGGVAGGGMDDLLSTTAIDFVESDVYFGPRVNLICDAHQLPFPDDAFDGLVVQAVLEHVLSPEKVVAEIHRVLKPGGIVYAETPFMQQVHEGAYDFTRFTELGHRRLFRYFDELGRGVVCGPATALAWSLRYFARSLPRRSKRAIQVLGLLTTVLTFWIKYLDVFLVSHPGASDGASGVWFMGRKISSPIPDDEIVASYSGAVNPVRGR